MKPQVSRRDASHGTDNGSEPLFGDRETPLSPLEVDRRLRMSQTVALVALAILMIAYTLYFARAIVLPATVAVVFNFVLSPLVRRLQRWGIPNMLGAALVMGAVTAILFIGAMQLREPATKWLRDAPTTIPELKAKLRPMEEPVKELAAASEQVEEIAETVEKDDVVKVDIQQPSLASMVFSQTTAFVASLLLTVTLLYFLLAAGDRFLGKCVELMPTFHDKRKIVETVRQLQEGIGAYLGTVTIINMSLGVVMAIALWLLGVPNAPLWGVMAALLNFVPFVGFLVGTSVIFLVSLLTFDSIGEALLPTVAYLVINSIEANLITPMILGRSMSMNPVAIILWMTLWGWLWGITGAILAVPLLAMVKIACDEIEALRPIGKFIAE